MEEIFAMAPHPDIAAAIAGMSLRDLESELHRQLSLLADGGESRQAEFADTRPVDLVHQPVVLLGAGSVHGRAFVEHALRAFNVVAVVDNPRRGDAFGPLIAVGDEALDGLMTRCPELVGVMCGCTDGAVAHFLQVWSRYPRPLLSIHQALRRSSLPQDRIATDHSPIGAVLEFANRTGCYGDDASRRSFLSVLLHRLSLDRRWLDGIRLPLSRMYFTTDALSIGTEEVLVDGGSFDGDTALAFAHRTGGRYRHIHCFEADPSNIDRLKERVVNMPDTTIHPVGLWSHEDALCLTSEGECSAITQQGVMVIPVRAMDDLSLGPVSVIKLDIEGAEIPALRGAAVTISRYKPKLAIAAYHKADDLMSIPDTIREIRQDYTFRVRHHSAYHNDTIIYAE